jgi:hypothetical protein
MNNWTLEDLHTGQYVLPAICNVYGDPHGSMGMMRQIGFIFDDKMFGLTSPDSGDFYKLGTATATVEYLNQIGARKLTRAEVRHLILYMAQLNFSLAPEDEPQDNG